MRPASRLPAARSAAWARSPANTNVTGSGTVSISISNAGTLTASNGTLDLTGTVSGRTLAISNAHGLRPEDHPARRPSAAAITINNANQTLEIGAAGSLTLSAAESITNGKIQLDGGTLTDASSVTLGAGAASDRVRNGARRMSPPAPARSRPAAARWS